MKNYIAYYRVSTKKQGGSGLGLEAQKLAVENYLNQNDSKELPPSFTEIESGKDNNRPELRKANNRCKETGSTLLIAKLDRLSRNVALIFTLKEELHRAGVDFVALDLPEANTLTLGIMASMAQHEREVISQRTKAGLQIAKLKGKKLGNPQNLSAEARQKAHESISNNAKENIEIRKAWHFIKTNREKGLSFAKIAEKLNMEGYRSRLGKEFHPSQVERIFKRFS